MLSVVIPAHNEEDNIVDAINKAENILDVPHELIIVNDHSTDNTAPLIQKLATRYANIRLVENLSFPGFANAIKAGFAEAKAELVVLVMADLCDDLSTIKEMLIKIEQGYDIVCGSRYINGGARLGGSKIKGFFSAFVGKTLHYLLGVPTYDIANAFKMYRKAVMDAVSVKSCGFEISMEIPLKAYYLGFKITEVPTVWRERARGRSNFRMLKLFPNYFSLYIWAIFKRILK